VTATDRSTVELPVLDLSALDFGAITMLSEGQRWRLVDRLLSDHGYDRDDVPAAWEHRGPLSAWCWLVLAVNGFEPEPDDPRPLVHWGIDLGFSSELVRRFTWALA
jgi:hypothetical protein